MGNYERVRKKRRLSIFFVTMLSALMSISVPVNAMEIKGQVTLPNDFKVIANGQVDSAQDLTNRDKVFLDIFAPENTKDEAFFDSMIKGPIVWPQGQSMTVVQGTLTDPLPRPSYTPSYQVFDLTKELPIIRLSNVTTTFSDKSVDVIVKVLNVKDPKTTGEKNDEPQLGIKPGSDRSIEAQLTNIAGVTVSYQFVDSTTNAPLNLLVAPAINDIDASQQFKLNGTVLGYDTTTVENLGNGYYGGGPKGVDGIDAFPIGGIIYQYYGSEIITEFIEGPQRGNNSSWATYGIFGIYGDMRTGKVSRPVKTEPTRTIKYMEGDKTVHSEVVQKVPFEGTDVFSMLASGITKTTDLKSENPTWDLVKSPTIEGLFTKLLEVPEKKVEPFTPNEEVIVPYMVVPKKEEPLPPKKEKPEENKEVPKEEKNTETDKVPEKKDSTDKKVDKSGTQDDTTPKQTVPDKKVSNNESRNGSSNTNVKKKAGSAPSKNETKSTNAASNPLDIPTAVLGATNTAQQPQFAQQIATFKASEQKQVAPQTAAIKPNVFEQNTGLNPNQQKQIFDALNAIEAYGKKNGWSMQKIKDVQLTLLTPNYERDKKQSAVSGNPAENVKLLKKILGSNKVDDVAAIVREQQDRGWKGANNAQPDFQHMFISMKTGNAGVTWGKVAAGTPLFPTNLPDTLLMVAAPPLFFVKSIKESGHMIMMTNTLTGDYHSIMGPGDYAADIDALKVYYDPKYKNMSMQDILNDLYGHKVLTESERKAWADANIKESDFNKSRVTAGSLIILVLINGFWYAVSNKKYAPDNKKAAAERKAKEEKAKKLKAQKLAEAAKEAARKAAHAAKIAAQKVAEAAKAKAKQVAAAIKARAKQIADAARKAREKIAAARRRAIAKAKAAAAKARAWVREKARRVAAAAAKARAWAREKARRVAAAAARARAWAREKARRVAAAAAKARAWVREKARRVAAAAARARAWAREKARRVAAAAARARAWARARARQVAAAAARARAWAREKARQAAAAAARARAWAKAKARAARNRVRSWFRRR